MLYVHLLSFLLCAGIKIAKEKGASYRHGPELEITLVNLAVACNMYVYHQIRDDIAVRTLVATVLIIIMLLIAFQCMSSMSSVSIFNCCSKVEILL